MMIALECSGVMTYARGERSCAETGFSENVALAIEKESVKARRGLISAYAPSAENTKNPAGIGAADGIINCFGLIRPLSFLASGI